MTDASGSPRRTSTFDIRRLTDDVRSVVIAVPAVAVGAVAVGTVAVGTGLTSVGATVGEASTHCMELATAQLTAGNEASSAPAAAVEPEMADNGDVHHHASVLHIPSPRPRPRVVRLNDEGAVQDAEDENDEVRREWLNVSDIFNSMDADGSGDVDRRELEQVVVSQGYSPEVATLLMEELDANDDGKLTLDEVREGLKHSSFAAGRPPVRKDYTPSLAASLYFIVGAVVYGQLEGWGALDSCYFLMYTCTTVGYGELTPVTGAGRLFTAVYALLGMTLVFSALAPLVEALQELIDRFEQHVTGWLEERGWLAPAIDPLDITLSSKEVKQISYARRYVLALFNPFIIMMTGMMLAVVVVPEGGWSDRFYWVIISMTTIGYGDVRATPGPMHDCPDSLSASTEWTLYCCAPPGQPPSLAADVCGVRVRRACAACVCGVRAPPPCPRTDHTDFPSGQGARQPLPARERRRARTGADGRLRHRGATLDPRGGLRRTHHG
jgi:hypothetical protein